MWPFKKSLPAEPDPYTRIKVETLQDGSTRYYAQFLVEGTGFYITLPTLGRTLKDAQNAIDFHLKTLIQKVEYIKYP